MTVSMYRPVRIWKCRGCGDFWPTHETGCGGCGERVSLPPLPLIEGKEDIIHHNRHIFSKGIQEDEDRSLCILEARDLAYGHPLVGCGSNYDPIEEWSQEVWTILHGEEAAKLLVTALPQHPDAEIPGWWLTRLIPLLQTRGMVGV